jgi:hypothetical protein
MTKRDRCQDNPRCCQGFQARCSDWDPASGLHQGQRSDVPRKQAGHMTATCDDQHLLRLTLAQTEPSTHDSTVFCRQVKHAGELTIYVYEVFPACDFYTCTVEQFGRRLGI